MVVHRGDAHEGGLARTIGTENEPSLTGSHAQLHVIEDESSVTNDGYVVQVEDGQVGGGNG